MTCHPLHPFPPNSQHGCKARILNKINKWVYIWVYTSTHFPPFYQKLTFSLSRSHEHEGLEHHESDYETLSTQCLDDFFNNEDFKLSLPLTWGHTNKSSATQNMQTKIRDFDRAFDSNDTKKRCASRQGDVGNLHKP